METLKTRCTAAKSHMLQWVILWWPIERRMSPTPAFLVSKRSKGHQFLANAFCMNSQQTFRRRKKIVQKRSLQIDNFHGFFIVSSAWLGFLNLDSACTVQKRSFYPEKSCVKRARLYRNHSLALWFFCQKMANQVKNPFQCHNYTIYGRKMVKGHAT